MMPTNCYPWMMQEDAQQELLEMWGELLLPPPPYVSEALFLGDVDRIIKEMNLWNDKSPVFINPEAALEVVEAYLF